ncbi:unnamed protein product [Rhizoctonia solani]|nr:unnamed protein product [Rhizoctonia solani]
MAVAFPYTPFPFNVTAISPSFRLSPVSVATNVSLGWAPSCATPECLPTASWSTSAINSTLSFKYWGWDVALDGNVKGNMSVDLFNEEGRIIWNPSGDKLFSLRGGPDDHLQRNITLRVLDASPGSQLTVTRARVNGSSRGDYTWPADRWIVPSDNDRLSYSGFIPQTSVAQAGSPTTYSSSTAGDSVSMQFNGSAFLIYGPCGPTNGLMRVTVDGNQQTVNTSKPFASDDCLLFQSPGQNIHNLHQLVVENVDGRTLGIDRFEFFRIQLYQRSGSANGKRVAVILCTIVGAIVLCSVVIVIYVRRSVKRKMNPEADRPRAGHRGFMWLHL